MGEPTQGPWIATNDSAHLGWRVETDALGYPNDGWVIVSEMMGPDAEANARLCAAARELLAALQEAEQHIITMYSAIAGGDADAGQRFAAATPSVVQMRAAIAKATGQ